MKNQINWIPLQVKTCETFCVDWEQNCTRFEDHSNHEELGRFWKNKSSLLFCFYIRYYPLRRASHYGSKKIRLRAVIKFIKNCFTLAARPSPFHRGWHLYQIDGNYEIHTAEMILYSMVSAKRARRRHLCYGSSRHLTGSAARYLLCAPRLRPLVAAARKGRDFFEREGRMCW